MRCRLLFTTACLGLALTGASASASEPGAAPATDASLTFERDIRPILKAHCFPCHGEGEQLKGGVDLRLRRLMLNPGESGAVLVPGHAEQSALVRLAASGEMPKSDKKLTPAQVARLRQWVEQGAPTARAEPDVVPRFFISEEEREFWSFQPIARPVPPHAGSDAHNRNPVDDFLLARLKERHLTFAPEAARAALIRRLSFDLTGIPPSAEESADFLADPEPDAYERLVDRLLQSPRFGERWGRHWLDVAGYADSNGGPESDSDRPWAWRYRDYVIRSFNADKPFDRFITEQLAGDELVAPPYQSLKGEDLDRLIATGFLRMAPDPTGDGPADPVLARNQVIADTIQIVATSLLGLTVQCAQCHDHRYDPIPHTDYFRIRAVFEPAFDLQHWKDPGSRSISLLEADARQRSDALETEAAQIDKEAQKLHDEFIEAFVQKQLLLVPEARRAEVLGARRTTADKRTPQQLAILREFPTFQDSIILGEVDRDGAKKVDEVRQRAAKVRSGKPEDSRVHCLIEEPGRNVETLRFHRGDPQQPKERIAPGGLLVLEPRLPQDIPGTNATLRTTGRRLAFAQMLTDSRHPLVARVLVNRFWHHLFGAGIVRSMADFGALGDRPSHPELLDWLAGRLIDGGWRLKPFLRTLVTSRAYRQDTDNPAAREADPENRLLGRQNLRRLDAESLRDAMIVAAGRAEFGMFGKAVPIALSAQGQVVVGVQNRDGNGDPTTSASAGADEYRRSVYLTMKRSAPVGVLETFDAPLANPNCESRASSTVALQALLLMNDPFVLARAGELAERVRRYQPHDFDEQVRLAWQHVYGVAPTEPERARSLDYMRHQIALLAARGRPAEAAAKPAATAAAAASANTSSATQRTAEELALASLCQALFASNRFLYLE